MTSITTNATTTNTTNNMNSFNSTTSSSSTSVLSNHSTSIMSFPNPSIQSSINNNSINVPLINTSQLDLDKLPSNVKFELDQLELELLEGDITQKGYDKKKAKLLAPYLNDSNIIVNNNNNLNLTKTNITSISNNINDDGIFNLIL